MGSPGKQHVLHGTTPEMVKECGRLDLQGDLRPVNHRSYFTKKSVTKENFGY